MQQPFPARSVEVDIICVNKAGLQRHLEKH